MPNHAQQIKLSFACNVVCCDIMTTKSKGDIEMPFEIYHLRAKTKAKPIIVKISKTSLVLSKVARAQLNNPEHVELAFAKDTNTIRIKPAAIGSGIALKKTKVLVPGFIKHFEITAAGKYFAEYNA
jgi:hypothetical protein